MKKEEKRREVFKIQIMLQQHTFEMNKNEIKCVII